MNAAVDTQTHARRVDAVLQIRLDGAEPWDVVAFVAEKEAQAEPPWKIEPPAGPLSQAEVLEYLAAADALLMASCRTNRKKRRALHKARRRALYVRAVQSGDIRTALSVLSDLAKLEGLYPAAGKTSPAATRAPRLANDPIAVMAIAAANKLEELMVGRKEPKAIAKRAE